MRPCSSPKLFHPLSRPVFTEDPRVLRRWQRRLKLLSNGDGLLLHLSITFIGTKLFYDPRLRGAFRSLLGNLLPSFVMKLEVSYRPSGFLFPHGHLLLPIHPRVLPFLRAFEARGAKAKTLKFRNKPLPEPFSLFQPRSTKQLPDLAPIEPLVDFLDSTIAVLQNSEDLPRYFAKQTYSGGLPPVLEHKTR